jgi:ACS family tartrate transporter-like MFS transporter
VDTGKHPDLEERVIAALTWRLVPFLFLLYVVAYLDRINVGFAALEMQKQLGFNDAVYGLGAGMFFAGYFFFQLPSNLLLERLGARRWIAGLMVIWGLISSAMFLVTTARSFYVLRFLLGSAEAGFFPGVILYLKRWFPAGARARTVARFMTASPLSGVIGGPISGALLGLHDRAGLAGWQWLFLLEGIPAMALGVTVLFLLAERPEEMTWLQAEGRTWLLETLARERQSGMQGPVAGRFSAFRSRQIWLLVLVYFGMSSGAYGISLWLPKLIKSVTGASNFRIGLLSTIPYVAAAIGMVAVGLHSDRSGERRWHVAACGFAGALAVWAAAASHSAWVAIIALSLAEMAVQSMMGPFWAMPTALLSSAAAAAGIAIINSVGNLGGFFGPYVIGLVRRYTGEFSGGLVVVGMTLVVSGCMALVAGERAGGSCRVAGANLLSVERAEDD